MKNKATGIRHHTGLVYVGNRSTIDSIRDHQRAVPDGRAGSRGGVVRVGLTDVGKPPGAHGRAKLIAQGINCLGNSSPFVLPHVICNTKILTHLIIMRIISISVTSVISVISDINKIIRIMTITFSA